MSPDPWQVHPTRSDPVIGWLSEVAGGRRGTRAGPTAPIRGWQPGAAAICVLIATGSVLLAVVTRLPCRRTLWASPGQFTNACYSDIPTVFSASGLSTRWPYVFPGPDGGHLTEPVGTGVLLKLLGVVTADGPRELRSVFDAGVLVVAAATVLLVVLVARLAGRRPWDVALVAASPVLVFVGLISLDLVAVSAAVAAVWALRRDRAGWAGLWLGLALCVRPVAVVVLIAVALVQWRRPHWAVLSRLGLVSGVVWLAVNLPVAVATPSGWGAYWTEVFTARIGTGSLWGLPRVVADALARADADVPALPAWIGLFGVALVLMAGVVLLMLHPDRRRTLLPLGRAGTGVLAVLVAGVPLLIVLAGPGVLSGMAAPDPAGGRWILLGGSALTVFLVGWLVRRAPSPPRLPVVVLLLLIGFQAFSPSLPVQAALWVLPFAALAVPSWRDLLIWGWSESFATTITWFHLYAAEVPDRGAPPWVYALALFARFTGLGLLAWQGLAQTLWPVEDQVRRTADDPCLPDRAGWSKQGVGPGRLDGVVPGAGPPPRVEPAAPGRRHNPPVTEGP